MEILIVGVLFIVFAAFMVFKIKTAKKQPAQGQINTEKLKEINENIVKNVTSKKP